MMEVILNIDKALLIFINSLNTDWLDSIMLMVTYKYTWLPLYAIIIYFLYLKKKENFFYVFGWIIITVLCADLFSSSLMKPYFQRLRPCHEPGLQVSLHLVGNLCGSLYGFVSSHAANTFSLATALFILFNKQYPIVKLFFVWAFIVSLSRVYLGVHYPGDVFVGAVVGVAMATLTYKLISKFMPQLKA